ncbi:MAG: DsrE family protein [Halobacteriales archaeon]
MHLGVVLDSSDPERIWNGLRLANTTLAADHDVELFLLGDGVEAPDVRTEAYNPPGLLKKFLQDGGDLYACGTCLDSRDLEADDLRPRASMDDLLGIVERADETVTIG